MLTDESALILGYNAELMEAQMMTHPFIFIFHIHRSHAHTSFASILAVLKFHVNSHWNYCILKKCQKKSYKTNKKIDAMLRLKFNKVELL